MLLAGILADREDIVEEVVVGKEVDWIDGHQRGAAILVISLSSRHQDDLLGPLRSPNSSAESFVLCLSFLLFRSL